MSKIALPRACPRLGCIGPCAPWRTDRPGGRCRCLRSSPAHPWRAAFLSSSCLAVTAAAAHVNGGVRRHDVTSLLCSSPLGAVARLSIGKRVALDRGSVSAPVRSDPAQIVDADRGSPPGPSDRPNGVRNRVGGSGLAGRPLKSPSRSSTYSRRLPNSAVLKIRVSGVQFPPWPPSNSMNLQGLAHGARTIGPRVGRYWLPSADLTSRRGQTRGLGQGHQIHIAADVRFRQAAVFQN
jgi:hypothetical protein